MQSLQHNPSQTLPDSTGANLSPGPVDHFIGGSGHSNFPVSLRLNKIQFTSFFFPSLMCFGVGKGGDFNILVFFFYSENADIGNISASQPMRDHKTVLTLELA